MVDHRPEHCPGCRAALGPDLPAAVVSLHDRIEVPEVKPEIERHRRLAVRCPTCGTRVVAAVPACAKGTPFGLRLHAIAAYLKTFQALSYERLQATLADLFGLTISQGGLMNLLRRAQGRFQTGRDEAMAALRRADVVASDETGVRIEGANAYHWVFRCPDAVVHQAAPTRAASVIRTMMMVTDPRSGCLIGIRPSRAMPARSRPVWRIWPAMSLMRVRRARIPCPGGWSSGCDQPSTWRARSQPSASTLAAKRRALERRLADILEAPTRCDLAHDLQRKFRRAHDQLLTFVEFPGAVEVTNNACERALRPAVIQRKVTNGYRAMWAKPPSAPSWTPHGSAREPPPSAQS